MQSISDLKWQIKSICQELEDVEKTGNFIDGRNIDGNRFYASFNQNENNRNYSIRITIEDCDSNKVFTKLLPVSSGISINSIAFKSVELMEKGLMELLYKARIARENSNIIMMCDA